VIPCNWSYLSHDVERGCIFGGCPSTTMMDKNFHEAQSVMYAQFALQISCFASTAVRLTHEIQITWTGKLNSQSERPESFPFSLIGECTGCRGCVYLEIVALSLGGSWQYRTDDDDVSFAPLTISPASKSSSLNPLLLHRQAFSLQLIS